jgi:hypothetical protein
LFEVRRQTYVDVVADGQRVGHGARLLFETLTLENPLSSWCSACHAERAGARVAGCASRPAGQQLTYRSRF